jgi:putative phage-type endonuclease
MIQGSAEWLEWRRNGIGGSDIPIIMGELEYGTPREIWRIKRGIEKEEIDNFAMQRGREAEPKIRALYELEYGIDVPACLVEHEEHPWMRCSLDGRTADGSLGVEFKYPGREKHIEACTTRERPGKVPSCYYPQVQWQLAVTGAQLWHYVSYGIAPGAEKEDIAVVPVKRDEEYIAKMLKVAKTFWEMVLNGEEPPMTEKDYLILEDLPATQTFERWKMRKLLQMQCEDMAEKAPTPEVKAEAKAQLKAVTVELEKARAEVIALVSHPRVICNGVQVIKQNRKNGPVYDIRLKTS